MTPAGTGRSYGRGFGFHRSMDTLGAIVGPLLVTILLPRVGHTQTLFVSLIPGLLSVLIFWAMVQDHQARVKTRHPFLRAAEHLPRSFLVYVGAVGVFGVGNFAHTFLILRASEAVTPQIGGVTASAVAIALYRLHNVLYAVGSFPVGMLADRAGKRGLLAIGYALFALMSVGLATLPLNLATLIPLFVLAGLHIGIVDTVEGSLAAELIPEASRGAGFGLLGGVTGVGDLISSVAVGLIWTRWSPNVAFWYAAVATALGAIALYATRPTAA